MERAVRFLTQETGDKRRGNVGRPSFHLQEESSHRLVLELLSPTSPRDAHDRATHIRMNQRPSRRAACTKAKHAMPAVQQSSHPVVPYCATAATSVYASTTSASRGHHSSALPTSLLWLPRSLPDRQLPSTVPASTLYRLPRNNVPQVVTSISSTMLTHFDAKVQ